MDKTLIIVPAFNEQEVILETLDKLKQFTKDSYFDYIIIDDGSTDDTLDILRDNQACFISHPVNLGLGEPFKTGIRYGLEHGYSKFINFDADGQHRLDNLNLLVSAADADYVVGSRFITARKPRSLRMLGSVILSVALKLRTGRYIADPTSGLLLINNVDFAKFFISQSSNRPEPSLYPKVVKRFKVIEVQVKMEDRTGGSSYFTMYNSVHFMLEQLFLIVLKG